LVVWPCRRPSQAPRHTGTDATGSGKARAVKYGYARVSTDDQNADMQHRALYRAGCRELFTDDGKSGATTKRPRLQQCLKKLNPGDTLIVWKLDRLGRSLRDLITMLDDLKQRGVKFRSLTEAIDTDTPTGRAMWQMIGVLAELERSLISERTRAGVTAAKARGVKFGRKPALTPERIEHAKELRILKCSPATVYRALAV
jgi:DNA invertase Pin-like site-specific DNA recombinase